MHNFFWSFLFVCFFLQLTFSFTKVPISKIWSSTLKILSISHILLVRLASDVPVQVPNFFIHSFPSVWVFFFEFLFTSMFGTGSPFHSNVCVFIDFNQWIIFISSLKTLNKFIIAILKSLPCASAVVQISGSFLIGCWGHNGLALFF